MTLERKVLIEFLHLYKELPCLWDNREVLYNNKEARDQAYEVLLEKYRQIYDDASILDVKKKIEHMRTAYRRERRKVLQSRVNGDLQEHQPSLWYYDELSFLEAVCQFGALEPVPREKKENTMKIEFVDQKLPKMKKRNISTIYLPEQHCSDDDDVHNSMDSITYNHDDENNRVNRDQSMHAPVTEAEAFGTTVGLQLNDLEPMQRVIAEKLISEIIFHARLNKLTIESSVNT